MVYSPKHIFIVNRNNSTDVDLTPSETISLGSLEHTVDCFSRLSLSSEGDDSCAIFVGMMHNGLPSSHMILEESSSEGGAALG
jgi:hypothetical protein